MFPANPAPSPLEDWTSTPLGRNNRLLIKRDDLLPFPLAGNKVRKLNAELADVDLETTLLVTVGAITSNHCRTTAMLAAQRGGRAHLILHGDPSHASARLALKVIEQLGATWKVVDPPEIASSVETFLHRANAKTHFIAGGCHTAAGVKAYMQAVTELSTQLPAQPERIVLASGTGATQAGLIAGCRAIGWRDTQVIGVSVARTKERGVPAIKEALGWVGCDDARVTFTDAYRAGGYGIHDAATLNAVNMAWRSGLPADTTYTGKALHALSALQDDDVLTGTTIFWHTGGLATHLYDSLENIGTPPRPRLS